MISNLPYSLSFAFNAADVFLNFVFTTMYKFQQVVVFFNFFWSSSFWFLPRLCVIWNCAVWCTSSYLFFHLYFMLIPLWSGRRKCVICSLSHFQDVFYGRAWGLLWRVFYVTLTLCSDETDYGEMSVVQLVDGSVE